ncbi:MAG: CRISPR-associated endonuclease Cas2 [Candidatus Aenigmarchaeota archaeon]|nr:CRISPR-associated endonuclease Cas2 [Candidatus Aenigmarchaeota archaeon]
MLHWVVYDITNNGKRTKVSKICKNYGLKRVQKSAFLGDVTRNRIEMLSIEVKEVLKDSNDCVFIFPSCDSCFGSKIIEGILKEDSVRKKDFLIIGGYNGEKIHNSN